MQLILSAISAGGMVGVADQYLCLLLVGLAAKFGWVQISPATQFMTSGWFLGIVGLFWFLTVAPAYLTTVAPGVMNSVNTVINFLSGFVVPISGALIALASVGVITGLDPQTRQILETVRLWSDGGDLAGSGWVVASGGALIASTLTGLKAAAKPGLSAATGTLGHTSAPIYATAENTASLLGMSLLYFLASVNPWLIVVVMVIVTIALAALLAYAIVQMRKLKSGLGEYFRLLKYRPGAGLTVALEFLIWGLGWMIRGHWLRGAAMFIGWSIFWGLWLATLSLTLALPFLTVCFIPVSLITFFWIASASARALLRTYPPVEEPVTALGPAMS
ncbi:MAG: DUF4126 domain-containing protein [Chloroflexota bacterium]